MLYLLIFLYAIYSLYRFILAILQLNFVKAKINEPAVVLNETDYKKAANVAIINQKFQIFSYFYEFFIALFWLLTGLKILQNFIFNLGIFKNELLNETLLVLAFLICGAILSLPLSIYEKFYKDKKLGFSNITPKIFIQDSIKSFVLTMIFGGIVIFALLFCIQNLGKFWWIYGFILSFILVLIVSLIYPTLIAPIFNKMSPLQNGELKTSIEGLLQKCGFKSSGVFVIDASKRDKRLNAYFGGFGTTKRVVLFDTLIQKLTQNEILAVLGHELGHFKHGDILKNIVLQFFVFAIIFGVFGNLNFDILNSIGLFSNGASLLIFMILFLPILQTFLEPIIAKISRSHEFGADNFGANSQSADDMISALKKLGSENKSFPLAHPLYSAVYNSHPSLFERIQELNENH